MKLNIQETNTIEFKQSINVPTLKKEIAAISNSIPNEEATIINCAIYLFVNDKGETLNKPLEDKDLIQLNELKE